MGLDMYLTKKTFVWTDHEVKKRELHSITMPEKYSHVKPERISEITEQVGYWRKANQIHAWFVKNVQDGVDDCGTYEVSEEQLEQILSDCRKVKSDSKLAESVLPTQGGFFFGGTEYDEFYMEEIDDTIEIIENLLKEKNEKGFIPGDIFYHASW